MNRLRIIEILDAYRPGEGLDADPEVRQALELAAKDPELAARRHQNQLFDEAFGDKFRSIEVPGSLYDSIIRQMKAETKPEPAPTSNILRWIHPAAFAAAASIIILLALSFTFWNRPERPTSNTYQTAGFSNPVLETADRLYANLNPSFRSRDRSELIAYLKNRGGLVPTSPKANFVWDRAFACDVISVDGKTVSLVCFMAPGTSDKYHLFTFHKRDFENFIAPSTPQIMTTPESCCATWGDEETIHVLYSDSGENNLRQLLEI